MKDSFKNFDCSVCMWYTKNKCNHLEHTMEVRPHDLCPDWKFIMEDV